MPFSVSTRPSARPRIGRPCTGFTLLELLAVLTIITILAAMVLGTGRRATEAGRNARARTELAALSAALENYRRTFGDFPPTDDPAQLLQALIGRRGPNNEAIAARSLIEASRFTTADVRDPFTDSSAVLIDPWGQAYLYLYKTQTPWTHAGYVLYSIGPDGRDSASLLPGGYPNATATDNADNIYANR